MRAAILAVALALPGASLAHDPRPLVEYSPAYAWFDGPGTPQGSDGRIRLVPQAGHGVAALTENQVYAYTLAYRRHFARLIMHQSAARAEAGARHAAWHEVLGRDAQAVPQGAFDTEPLRAGALPLRLTPFE